MKRLHFLNVREGDCIIIENDSDISIIDICNGSKCYDVGIEESISWRFESAKGNFHQKEHPENPICYLQDIGINKINRFILTHPDMDHMDGIKSLFEYITNSAYLYHTDNKKVITDFSNGRYKEEDWKFYQQNKDKAIEKYSGDNIGNFFVLSPTKEIVKQAMQSNNYNSSSYVLLWEIGKYKVVFAGDSDKVAWEHTINNHKLKVSDIDILIAPHHGRKNNQDFSFVDVLKPKYTLLGNTERNSDYLAYKPYQKYGKTITNNQGGNIIVQLESDGLNILVENKNYAEKNHSFNQLYNCNIGKRVFYYLDIIK